MFGHRFGSDVYNIYVKAFLDIREHWEYIVGNYYAERREGLVKEERLNEESEEEEERDFRKKKTQNNQPKRNAENQKIN